MKTEVADMMVLANNVVCRKPLTLGQLRIWLDRECPPGSWRDFLPSDERDWYEFEAQTDVQADNTHMVTGAACATEAE